MTTFDNVTLALTIRETYTPTLKTLDSILEYTPKDVKIVFVASNIPPEIMKGVEERAQSNNIEIVYVDSYLSPNQARNLATQNIQTEYVVFIDNDALVSKNWLEPLIQCAEEEKAAIVSPLIFERYPVWKYVHIAGGESKIEIRNGTERVCYQKPFFTHHDLVENPIDFERSETTLVEFHAVLVRKDFLDKTGGLDEKIRCMYEEWDMCIQAQELGQKIFFEPKSRVAYLAPLEASEDDIRYFDLRWSELWLEESIERLKTKYDLTPNTGNLKVGKGFVKDHRLHKYGNLRKMIASVLGPKVSSVIMNRVVGKWERYTNSLKIRPQYKSWKEYTENMQS